MAKNTEDMKTALYIGRFQLFHLGHLDVVKFIDAEPDISKILIAIGSSQFSYQNKSPKWPWANNPFTYEERKLMVEKSLEGEIAKPIEIQPVPDYFNYPKWFSHIVDNLPKFECLYTVDKAEKEYFEKNGYEVRVFPRQRNYHAAILREKICKGDKVYREALTKGTLDLLDSVHGEERIKMLFARDISEKLRLK